MKPAIDTATTYLPMMMMTTMMTMMMTMMKRVAMMMTMKRVAMIITIMVMIKIPDDDDATEYHC